MEETISEIKSKTKKGNVFIDLPYPNGIYIMLGGDLDRWNQRQRRYIYLSEKKVSILQLKPNSLRKCIGETIKLSIGEKNE